MQYTDSKGRIHRDDDATRPVSTLIPQEYSPMSQHKAPELAPSTSHHGSTLDTIGFYGSFAFLIISAIALISYLIYVVKMRWLAQRLRDPPKTLEQDLKVAFVTYQTALEEHKSAAISEPIILRNYGSKNAAVRRALIVNSANPSRYTNFSQALEYTRDPNTIVTPENETLYVAPEDLANHLRDKSLFNPFHVWFDDPKKAGPEFKKRNILYGFFHPYSNAGGGGERVLWAAVKATLEQNPQNTCVIYTGFDTKQSPTEIDQDGESLNKPKVADPSSILRTVSLRFGLNFDIKRVVFIYVPKRHLVDPLTWPRATLIGQAFGSSVLAYEAVSRLLPDVFVDTMGYPFAYPLVNQVTDAPIAAYVHYPVISTDMLSAMLKNTENVSAAPTAPGKKVVSDATVPKPKPRNIVFRLVKYIYWRLIAAVYSYCGTYVSVAVANSSWTLAHMRKQWAKGHTPSIKILKGLEKIEQAQKELGQIKSKSQNPGNSTDTPTDVTNSATSTPDAAKNIKDTDFGTFVDGKPVVGSRIKVLYPPCATQDLDVFPIDKPRSRDLVYVAQFRPEKRHELVLREFSTFLEKVKANSSTSPQTLSPRLVLIGSIRNDDDRNAVYSLRLLAHELGLEVAPESATYSDVDDNSDVEFVLDAPWSVVTRRLSQATIGINAMWNEHFGMVIVEYMAAGLVPVVHNSGGPKLDIVVPFPNPKTGEYEPTGYLFRAPNDPKEDYKLSNVSIASTESNSATESKPVPPPFTIDGEIPTLSECLYTAYTLPEPVVEHKRAIARAASHQFSDAAFAKSWAQRVEVLSKLERKRKAARNGTGIHY